MNSKRAFLTVTVASLISSAVLAHHGYAGRYDEENPVTLEGTIVEVQLINPHASVIFDVRDESGKVVRWTGLLGSATTLRRDDGWTKDTLKPGDRITIQGPAAANGAPDMLLLHECLIKLTDTGEEIRNTLGTGRGGRGF